MDIITIFVITVVTCVILYFWRPKKYPQELNGQWVGEAKEGETRILRGYNAKDKTVDYNKQGYETINDLVMGMTKENKREFIGYRTCEETICAKVIKQVVNGKEVEKPLYKYRMSPYKYFSSVEFHSMINRLSNGLKQNGFKKGDRIGIFCDTRYEWMAMMLAATRQGIVAVTVYATLGDDSVRIALEETEVKAIVVCNETMKRIKRIAINTNPILINVDGDVNEKTDELLSFQYLNSYEESTDFETVTSTDLAMIMYTSGTSASPKGVTIQQKQILMLSVPYSDILKLGRERIIAYLPLAHIFEICIEFGVMMNFGTIGYGAVRTLTSGFCHKCESDLIAFQPTAMIGVPTVFNRVRKGIIETISKASSFSRFMFNMGYWLKEKLYTEKELRTPLLFQPLIWMLNNVVFKRIGKTLLGDRLKLVVVGGSALPVELQKFLTTVLPNIAVIQGLGMTELAGAACAMPIGDASTSTIGVCFPTYEIKLRDVPELGYLTTDNPPRGELMIRGYPVTKGYFNRPDENKQAFTEDGWLCTGDIAVIKDDLHICIIDRKKNIVKQPCGEYISLEFIESKYHSNKLVDNVCAFADPFHDFVVGLIVPNKAVIRELSDLPFEQAIENEEVLKKVREMLKENDALLSERQKIKHVKLVAEEWTAENELLTAALKLKRPVIFKKYLTDIQRMFSMG